MVSVHVHVSQHRQHLVNASRVNLKSGGALLLEGVVCRLCMHWAIGPVVDAARLSSHFRSRCSWVSMSVVA